MRFALHSKRVLTEQGLQEATLVIHNDTIETIEPGPIRNFGEATEDLENAVIMPGLIDSHVHINEPGRTEWEGFDTATRSAAAGGITTVVDMPLNSSPVTTDVSAFKLKLDAARKSLHVNCGFYGGIVPDNLSAIEALINAGVLGIKAFLTHSGIDDFPNVSEEHLNQVLPLLKKLDSTLLVHAELDSFNKDSALLESTPRSYQAYLRSRPRSWEDNAIRLMIRLCEKFNTPIHIVHLSSSNSITALEDSINRGLPISVETCPHYLVFNAEDIQDGQTQYKCAPPIREKENNDQLWEALKDGIISFVVTDHSPAPPEMKELNSGDFRKAWGGIAGLQFSLPAIWTHGTKRGFTIEEISNLMSLNVAKFLKLDDAKGRLLPGYDADLVIWNPEKEFTVTSQNIHHKHKITPYTGLTLKGVVQRTYVNGNLVFYEDEFPVLNKGKVILRK